MFTIRSLAAATLFAISGLGSASAGDLTPTYPVSTYTPPTASQTLKCKIGLDVTNGYLLGQAGVKVSKAIMLDPWGECEHSSGFFGSVYNYSAMRGPWHEETDGFGGWRGKSGNFDFGIRGGFYHVDAGHHTVNISNERAWAGYTTKFSDVFSVRWYANLDHQHAWAGFPGLNRDVIGIGLGATASWKAFDRLTLLTTVESWGYPNKGFFTTGKPNFKVVPAFSYDLGRDWSLNANWMIMQGNQFDPKDRSWKNMPSIGISKTF